MFSGLLRGPDTEFMGNMESAIPFSETEYPAE